MPSIEAIVTVVGLVVGLFVNRKVGLKAKERLELVLRLAKRAARTTVLVLQEGDITGAGAVAFWERQFSVLVAAAGLELTEKERVAGFEVAMDELDGFLVSGAFDKLKVALANFQRGWVEIQAKLKGVR